MTNKDIKRDSFIKYIFEEGGVERPSDGFTKEIIKNVKAQSGAQAIRYKPVISLNAWIAAFVFIAVILLLALQQSGQGQGSELYQFDLSPYIQKTIAVFDGIAGSFRLTSIFKTALFAFSFFIFTSLLIIEFRSRSFYK